MIWIADVGQSRYEEVNRAVSGRAMNFGWRVLEGRHCYIPSSGCSTAGTRLPLVEYAQGSTHCSVTGGYVYRGTLYPSLVGRYIFGDFCSGWIWNISATASSPATLPAAYQSGRSISSFGESYDGEVYVTDLNGAVLRIRD
jgi:hypothetical protein